MTGRRSVLQSDIFYTGGVSGPEKTNRSRARNRVRFRHSFPEVKLLSSVQGVTVRVREQAVMSGEHASLPTILVVDDEVPLADLFVAWLEDEYEILVEYGGEPALETLSENRPDVVLLDRQISDLSGDEVLVTLRDWGIDARVAMVTGARPDIDIVDLGFDDYLVKPVERDTLRSTVGRLVDMPSYDSVNRELSILRIKRNVLQIELTGGRLMTDERYGALVARIEELEAVESTYRTRSKGDVRPKTAED